VKIKTDECGDHVIPGKHGQVYVDGTNTCLIRRDAPVVVRRKLEALGGKLWAGDISADRTGRRVQDVRVKDIPEDKIYNALRLAGVKAKKRATTAMLAALAKHHTAAVKAARESRRDRLQGRATA
jgi:hypothetical protein